MADKFTEEEIEGEKATNGQVNEKIIEAAIDGDDRISDEAILQREAHIRFDEDEDGETVPVKNRDLAVSGDSIDFVKPEGDSTMSRQALRSIKESVKKAFDNRDIQSLDDDMSQETKLNIDDSTNEEPNFKRPKKRQIPNEVDRALSTLVGKFTLRQLTEFVCDCNGLPRPVCERSAQPVVRRIQNERRQLVDAHGEVHGKLLLAEKPSFPFVLMQVGEFQGYLPPTYTKHPQQEGRPNSITLIPVKERLKYEFTMYNKHRTISYAVWIVAFTTIEAVHVTNDLLYLRLNQPAQQISSFFGDLPCPSYDVSDGELQTSLLHYFRLHGNGEPIVTALLRYNQSFFEPKLVTYGAFFKVVRLMQRKQRETCQESRAQATGHVLAENPVARPGHPFIEPFDINTMIRSRSDVTVPQAPSCYAQSQYTVQQPISAHHQVFSDIELVDPVYQMSMTPRYHDNESLTGSLASMSRDNRYLTSGLSEADYNTPQPTFPQELQTATFESSLSEWFEPNIEFQEDVDANESH